MGAFANLYVVPEPEIPAAAVSRGAGRWPNTEWKWIDNFHFAPLYASVCNVTKEEAQRALRQELIEEPGARSYDERDPANPEEWLDGFFVTRFPSGFVHALANLNPSLRAETGQTWQASWPTERMDFRGLLEKLVEFARVADAQGDCLVLVEESEG